MPYLDWLEDFHFSATGNFKTYYNPQIVGNIDENATKHLKLKTLSLIFSKYFYFSKDNKILLEDFFNTAPYFSKTNILEIVPIKILSGKEVINPITLIANAYWNSRTEIDNFDHNAKLEIFQKAKLLGSILSIQIIASFYNNDYSPKYPNINVEIRVNYDESSYRKFFVISPDVFDGELRQINIASDKFFLYPRGQFNADNCILDFNYENNSGYRILEGSVPSAFFDYIKDNTIKKLNTWKTSFGYLASNILIAYVPYKIGNQNQYLDDLEYKNYSASGTYVNPYTASSVEWGNIFGNIANQEDLSLILSNTNDKADLAVQTATTANYNANTAITNSGNATATANNAAGVAITASNKADDAYNSATAAQTAADDAAKRANWGLDPETDEPYIYGDIWDNPDLADALDEAASKSSFEGLSGDVSDCEPLSEALADAGKTALFSELSGQPSNNAALSYELEKARNLASWDKDIDQTDSIKGDIANNSQVMDLKNSLQENITDVQQIADLAYADAATANNRSTTALNSAATANSKADQAIELASSKISLPNYNIKSLGSYFDIEQTPPAGTYSWDGINLCGFDFLGLGIQSSHVNNLIKDLGLNVRSFNNINSSDYGSTSFLYLNKYLNIFYNFAFACSLMLNYLKSNFPTTSVSNVATFSYVFPIRINIAGDLVCFRMRSYFNNLSPSSWNQTIFACPINFTFSVYNASNNTFYDCFFLSSFLNFFYESFSNYYAPFYGFWSQRKIVNPLTLNIEMAEKQDFYVESASGDYKDLFYDYFTQNIDVENFHTTYPYMFSWLKHTEVQKK